MMGKYKKRDRVRDVLEEKRKRVIKKEEGKRDGDK